MSIFKPLVFDELFAAGNTCRAVTSGPPARRAAGDEWYGMLPTGNLGTVRGTRPVADGYPSSETGLRSVRRQQSRATRNLLAQLLPRSPRYFRISDAPDGAHTERALGEASACAFRGLTLK